MDKITHVLKTITESELKGQNVKRQRSPSIKSDLLKPVSMKSGPVSIKSGINSIERRVVIEEVEEEGLSPSPKGPATVFKQGTPPRSPAMDSR